MATKDETRQAILEAAQNLFLRYGPVKTSIADIAKDLGMSAANIYNYYPSRDAILEAVGTQNLLQLKSEITEEIARTAGDWPRIAVLFISTAQHLRIKLENEKDILQLQALVTRNSWKFIEDFHDFLHRTAKQILQEAIAGGRLEHHDPDRAVEALFDCMMSALEPFIITKFSKEDHFRRINAQLGLLEKAFH